MSGRGDGPDSVARGTALILLTYAGTAGFTAILTVYLTRALGPEGFGLFSLAFGIAGLLTLPADLGIGASASRFMAEQRGDRAAMAGIFAAATRLKLIVAGAVALALAALAGPIADGYGRPELVGPLRGMALALAAMSVMTMFSQLFIAAGRSASNLRMVVSESSAELSISVALVATGAGAAGAAFGRGIAYAAGALIGLGMAMRLFGRGAAAVHRRGGPQLMAIGRYAGWLFVVNGAYTVFNQIDILLIGSILGIAAVGQFSAPLRLTFLLHYPGLAIANAVTPRVAAEDGRERGGAEVQSALRILLVIQAAMIAPVIVWADPIVRLVLGPDYTDSVDVLRFMAPFIFLQGIAPLVSLSLNFLGEARRRVPVAVAAVVVNAVVDLILLPEMGVSGAAIGTSVAYAVYVGGHLWLCRSLLGVRLRPLAGTLTRSLVAAAGMAAALWVFGTRDLSVLEWLGGGVLGSAAFLGVLVAAREVSVADLRAASAAVRGRLGASG